MAGANRLLWIDYLKALGITFVYLGHSGVICHDGIYLFHMPLFFIISGFLWNNEKFSIMSLKSFTEHKIKTYIFPYLKISSICLIIFGLLIPIIIRCDYNDILYHLPKYIFGIFVYSRGTVEWLPQCSPLWFLTCLFFAEIIFYFIKHIRNERDAFFAVVVSGVIGFLLSLAGKIFPLNIDNAFTVIPYLYVGNWFRRFWARISDVKYAHVLMPLALVFFFFGEKGTDFDGNHFDNVVLVYFESLIICYVLFVYVYSISGTCGGVNVTSLFHWSGGIRFY